MFLFRTLFFLSLSLFLADTTDQAELNQVFQTSHYRFIYAEFTEWESVVTSNRPSALTNTIVVQHHVTGAAIVVFRSAIGVRIRNEISDDIVFGSHAKNRTCKLREQNHLHLYELCLSFIHCCPSASGRCLCRFTDNDERTACCGCNRHRWTFERKPTLVLSMNSILQEGRTSWIEVAFTILIADGDRVRLGNSNRLYFRKNFIVVDVLPVLTAVSIRTRVNKWESSFEKTPERQELYSRFEMNSSAKYWYSSGRDESSWSRFSMYSGNAATCNDQRLGGKRVPSITCRAKAIKQTIVVRSIFWELRGLS